MFAAAGVSGLTCAPGVPPEDTSVGAPVYIVQVEGLTPPAIGHERAYQPSQNVAFEGEGASGQAISFRLTLATAAPNAVRVRLKDLTAGVLQELQRVKPPSAEERGVPGDWPRVFNEQVADLLAAGRGVFWQDDTAGSIEHVFAFLIPESIRGPFIRLEAFTATAADGTALHISHIELVRGFFCLAVIGDSVAWGNGLLDRDKYPWQVADEIETRLGRKAIIQMQAQSGARIVPAEGDGICDVSCYREAPAVSTSITAQAGLIERPDLVELVLMDGCINDISVTTIINPDTPEEQLRGLSNQYCHEAMAGLLRTVRERMPQALIAVTGYYPIVGPATDLLGLQTFFESQDVPTDEDLKAFVAGAAVNSATFAEASRADLAAAADEVNAARPDGPPIVFVDPGFTADNAIFAPAGLLWGLTADTSVASGLNNLDLKLFPEDPQLPTRVSACLKASGSDLSLECLYASVGHPNKRGARRYAEAILAALGSAGMIPILTEGP